MEAGIRKYLHGGLKTKERQSLPELKVLACGRIGGAGFRQVLKWTFYGPIGACVLDKNSIYVCNSDEG